MTEKSTCSIFVASHTILNSWSIGLRQYFMLFQRLNLVHGNGILTTRPLGKYSKCCNFKTIKLNLIFSQARKLCSTFYNSTSTYNQLQMTPVLFAYWWWWWFSCYIRSDSCDPMDCSPPDSSVCGVLQARILEWGAISWLRDWTRISWIAGGFFTTELPEKPHLHNTF